MDEMNKLPEEQSTEGTNTKDLSSSEIGESKPAPQVIKVKASVPKTPLIVGGIIAGVVAIAVAIALVFVIGGGTHEHTFDAWKVVEKPTCLADGTEERTCKCGEKEARTVDALGHTEVIDKAVAPTCTVTGLTEGKHCSVCEAVIAAQSPVSKIPHTYDNSSDIDCNACGEKRPVGCTHSVTETIPGKNATCSATGLTDGAKCADCGEIVEEQTAIPMVAHTYDNEYDDECNVCGHKRDAECAHTETVTIPGKAATCTETGLTDGKKCKKCGEIIVSQIAVETKPHTEVIDSAVAASCTKIGLTEGKHCSVCNTVTLAQNKIPMTPHTYDDKYDDSCNVCGFKRDTECAHTETEVIKGTAATCSSTGLSDGKKCSSCQETLVVQTVLPKIACNYKSVVTEPTCEEIGYTTHTCTMCNNSTVDTYTENLGHKWGDWEASGTQTLRQCINKCNCEKTQRVSSISANYSGIRLLTGETVSKSDVSVSAKLSDNTTIDVTDFTLENDVMTVDGVNNVTVKFHTVSTTISVLAIYDNMPGTTAANEFTYSEEDDAITITGFIGSSTDIIIPAHINRVPVRHIGYEAFCGKEKIKSVVIPDSVKTIVDGAFNGCIRVVSASFSKKLTSIGDYAFYGCISLTEVDIPASVTAIGSWNGCAFENCTALKKVTIGDNTADIATTEIGWGAFRNCSALTEVFIGNRVKNIGMDAFYGCYSLAKLTIGTGVQTIESGAFSGCEALTSLVIPDSVVTIGDSAFENCIRIASVSFGERLTTIGASAFRGCISLTEVDIPANVITIGGWNGATFENCTALKKVTIGDDASDIAVTTIGTRAFANCTSLKEVNIGSNVKEIAEDAFEGCTSLN